MRQCSSEGTLFPNCKIRGTMLAAEAPPNSNADTRDGRIRNAANSGGNDEAESFSMLDTGKLVAHLEFWDLTYRRRATFSASLFKLKLSRPPHTLTKRLLEKKPEPSPAVSVIPRSKKVLGGVRDFGLGWSNFLNDGNTDCGIDPRDEGCGGGWGACTVGGGGSAGLKTVWRRRPRA